MSPVTDSEPDQEPPTFAPPAPGPPPVGRSTLDVPGWVYLCAAGFVLFAVLGVGLALVAAASMPGRLPFASAAGTSSAEPSDSSEPYDTYSPAPEGSDPSPDGTYKDPASMDQESTDTTPFTEAQVFPEDTVTSADGTSYTLAASGFFSACSDSGGADTEALMRQHGCGNMLTADYANDSEGMFISTMVIPLTSADDASAVEDALDADDSAAFDELVVFCPHDAAYNQTICHGSADPSWHATFTHYHRYLIIAMTVMESGADTPDDQHVRNAGAAVVDEVRTALG